MLNICKLLYLYIKKIYSNAYKHSDRILTKYNYINDMNVC